jgi:hypothetical protein
MASIIEAHLRTRRGVHRARDPAAGELSAHGSGQAIGPLGDGQRTAMRDRSSTVMQLHAVARDSSVVLRLCARTVVRATTAPAACASRNDLLAPAAACRRHRTAMAATKAMAVMPAFRAPEPAIVKMPPRLVLSRLRIVDDDFSTYQGYRRYAEIVAARAPNTQDARIFAA